MSKYDFLIVGCGLWGSVFAEQCKKNNKKCLIIEKRNHIAGNCYTENKDNIHIHKYGPHIFHTNNKEIWEYVQKFSEFNNFVNKPKVMHGGKLYSFPINLMTMQQLWGVKTPHEAIQKVNAVKVKINNPQNLEEWILSQVGEALYYTFIHGYTKKQWGTDPKNLPSSIIKRLPIRYYYDENYYFDNYQGIPTNGYTGMISNMLEGTEVQLNVDYFAKQEYYDSLAKHTVYTGPIDKFFNYCYGELPYRSVKFRHQKVDIKDYQGNAIVNYTDYDIPYTRIIEHKHFTKNYSHDFSYITTEYPQDWSKDIDPYYPIGSDVNTEKYNQYKKLIDNKKYIFGGRLAEYKYYDMHQVIGSALAKFKKLF